MARAMEATQVCSRCGSEGHQAAMCSKSFLQVFCAGCKKPGHEQARCPIARKAVFEEREKRRAAEKAAFEERQKRRAAEQAAYEERRAAEKAAYEERQQRRAERATQRIATDNADARSDYSSSYSTAASTSTAATRADMALAQDRGNCTFCGAKRIWVQRKAGKNMCKDRCQTCFRKFEK